VRAEPRVLTDLLDGESVFWILSEDFVEEVFGRARNEVGNSEITCHYFSVESVSVRVFKR
jgi:hypothetical protein